MIRRKETLMKYIFMITACVSVLAVAIICLFLFAGGIPAMGKTGIIEFLGGMEWRPSSGIYGIFPMIVASLYVTAGAVVLGVPLGVLSAVFLARFCPKPLYAVLKPTFELLAGVPSIIYGYFGLTVLVPLVGNTFGGSGKSVLTASLILALMILPTVINITENALSAVPESYYEGSLALGATHERSVFRTVLPAAKSGILAGVVLGVGRAIGETTAVSMVLGNQAVLPGSILDGARTLTVNIVLEMSYATGLHREMLIATAVVLFVFVLAINVSFSLLKSSRTQALPRKANQKRRAGA